MRERKLKREAKKKALRKVETEGVRYAAPTARASRLKTLTRRYLKKSRSA